METKGQSVNQCICDICGALINEEDSYSVDDTVLCWDCYERNTVICACCGDRILSMLREERLTDHCIFADAPVKRTE